MQTIQQTASNTRNVQPDPLFQAQSATAKNPAKAVLACKCALLTMRIRLLLKCCIGRHYA